MNKILSSDCDNPDRQTKSLTRSPSQYPKYEKSDEILSIDEYKDFVVIFDDMLEHKQKIFHVFLLAVDIKELMVIIYHRVILSYLY